MSRDCNDPKGLPRNYLRGRFPLPPGNHRLLPATAHVVPQRSLVGVIF